MYIQRTLEFFLKQVSQQFPVLLVTGPRQVGKTTILKHLSKGIRKYVTLDDPQLAQLANEDPALFLQRFTPPVLIDEIQYAPALFPYIKMIVDKQSKPGAFWLTGSQQFQLMQNVSESLAGRVGIVNLLGLSLKEQQRHPKIAEPFLPIEKQLKRRAKYSEPLELQEIYRIIWRGSFPALYKSRIDRDIFYSSYVQTYLQRDVRDLANVSDSHVFLKFLRAAAARTGQLLNMLDMSRDCGISPMTAKHWLAILEASGIIYLLEPYYNNITKRLIKTPKLYFLDTGLCAYLTEWSSPETLEAGAMSGAMLETFILIEILKSYWHNGKRAPLYYYRDKDQKEIDLLIVQDEVIYPLEFKKSAQINRLLTQQFSVLKKLNKKIGNGGMICLVSSLLPITTDDYSIPVGFL
jgi:predicted AAA+ superfamily ATPase